MILESRNVHELARVPWELACLGESFLVIDPFTPIIRRPDYVQLKNRLRVQNPLRLALASAAPEGHDSVLVEEELVNAALALGDQVAEGRIIVDEVLNCTREKLSEIFRSNTYDIIFFIGHGCLSDSGFDSVPDFLPGSKPGSVPGSLPGSMPGSMPGSKPGSVPDSLPGSMPGSIPGSVSDPASAHTGSSSGQTAPGPGQTGPASGDTGCGSASAPGQTGSAFGDTGCVSASASGQTGSAFGDTGCGSASAPGQTGSAFGDTGCVSASASGSTGSTGYLILESPDGEADPVSGHDFQSLLHRQTDLSLVLLGCCNAATASKAESEGWRGFRAVARSVLEGGVPEVIASQAVACNAAGRKVMKAFFRELCLYLDSSKSNGGSSHEFNVGKALSQARSEVETDRSQFHDFYHFIHLSALAPDVKIEVRRTSDKAQESIRSDWRDRVIYRTPNYTAFDGSFTGRFIFISRIEHAWWHGSVKAVGIYGPDGIGKTFLCNRMEERTLCGHLPARRFERSIWIDFQEGVGNTLAGFLTQLVGLAHDLGFPAYREVLDDSYVFPTPTEKLRPLVEHLKKRASDGKFLLILDNLEPSLDERGNFHDPELGTWFRELLAHTPATWKVLVTCRYRFPFFPDGRQPVKTIWFHLCELGFTERIRLINQQPELRRRPNKDKAAMIRLAGGIPYQVMLVVEYLQKHPALPHDLIAASKDPAAYARLDWFLSQLTTDEREWLFISAALPPPRPPEGIVVARAIRDSVEDLQPMEKSFDASLRKLIDLNLVTIDDGGSIHLHPLIIHQLLQSQGGRFGHSPMEIRKINKAIGDLFYLLCGQVKDHQVKARVLLQGLEPVLAQDDTQLLNAYLQECAITFYGFVPVLAFSDIARRVEDALFEKADEDSFCTLGLFAQTLLDMKHPRMASSMFERMHASDRLPDTLRGKVLHAMGMIYQEQQQWEPALENYRLALEWNGKTDNQTELGGTYHQIGMIREEQGEFSMAMSAFADGLAISLQTECNEGINKNLASLRRIMPKVTAEDIEGLKEILPDEAFRKIISKQ